MANRCAVCAVVLGVVLILSAMTSQAQEGPSAAPSSGPPEGAPEGPPVDTGWRVDVGGGVLAAPRFPGSKYTRVQPFPAVELHYGDRFFASVRDGVGYNLVRVGGFTAGPVLNFAFARNESDDHRALNGLGDVALTVEAGAFVRYDFGPIASAKLEVRQGIGGHDGLIVDGSLGLNAPPLLNNKLFLTAGPNVSFYDRNFTRAYYGVTAVQSARSGYAAFSPDAGTRAGASVGATYLLTPKVTLVTFAGYSRLLGDIGRSPIVRGPYGSRDQFTAGANLTYRFSFGG